MFVPQNILNLLYYWYNTITFSRSESLTILLYFFFISWVDGGDIVKFLQEMFKLLLLRQKECEVIKKMNNHYLKHAHFKTLALPANSRVL